MYFTRNKRYKMNIKNKKKIKKKKMNIEFINKQKKKKIMILMIIKFKPSRYKDKFKKISQIKIMINLYNNLNKKQGNCKTCFLKYNCPKQLMFILKKIKILKIQLII